MRMRLRARLHRLIVTTGPPPARLPKGDVTCR